MGFERYTLKQMSDELASAKPAPGGGTAAAMSAMYGAALIEMVLNLSSGKPEFSGYAGLYSEKLAELKLLRADLAAQMDKDAAAFDAVMAAFKMPRDTDGEKKLRTQAVRLAFYHAAQEPLCTAALAVKALQIAAELTGRINENAASDLLVGADLCHCGCKGALANVAINIPSVKDKEKIENLNAETIRLKQTAYEYAAVVKDYFYAQEIFAVVRE